MQFLIFAISYPIIWLLSKLPMRILYLFSDFFYFLIYTVFSYRKKIVLENLRLAFPEKSEEERKTISRKFFSHFTDLFIESIKAFSISEKEIKKRFVYKNIEVLNDLEKNKKSIILTGSHYANWEWVIYLSKLINFSPYSVYKKIQNPYFEKKLKDSRAKFGAIFIKTTHISKTIETNKLKNNLSLYGFLNDQSPQLHKTYYWANFFGVKVPVITGFENLAKKYDLTIVNYNATKIKRGYYEVYFQLITENPRKFEDYEITDQYLKITEDHIKKQPEFYLWSHNRFKHQHRFEEWQKMQIAKQQTKNSPIPFQ